MESTAHNIQPTPQTPEANVSARFEGVVRAATEADEATVVQLLYDLQALECTLHPAMRQWTMDDARAYWQQAKMKIVQNRGFCFVAEDTVGANAGRLVGVALGWVETDPFAIKLQASEISHGVLTDGYVLQEYRRAGVYSKMVREMESYFLSLGLKRVRRSTFANNSGLLAAANAQGYELFEITLEKMLD